ncbi:hypothetical protein [Floridanema evergladense]|uniref:Transmembrane protein n=1 Tax=Floridaenema evergladense BLCC-F167 TaxID=3153639 RepID=A0ABV4WW75_9CYAN
MQPSKSGMANNRLAQKRSPELPKFKNSALNQQGRRPVPPIQLSPRLKNPKKQTLTERRRRINPALHQPLPWNKLLAQLVVKRPLLVLLTFCGGMLIVAVIAAIGLTLPESVDKLKSKSTPVASSVTPSTNSAIVTAESSPIPTPTAEYSPATITVRTTTEQNPPLGLYAMVGAGCAIGAWLLYRRRLKLAAKMGHKPLPKSLPSEIQEKSVTQQKNGKPVRRNAPGSRKPLVANPGKIPVADSIVRWPNGQSLPRHSQKLLTDTTAKRRKHSIIGDR